MEAEASGARMGVQIDDDGFLAESSVAAVAMVDCDGALRSPRYRHSIASASSRRRPAATPGIALGLRIGVDAPTTEATPRRALAAPTPF